MRREILRALNCFLAATTVVACVAAPAGARLDVPATVTATPPAPGEVVATAAVRSVAARAGMTGLLDGFEEWLTDQTDLEQYEGWGRLFVRDWSGDGAADDVSIHEVVTIDGAELRSVATLRASAGDSGDIMWTKRWKRDDGTIFFAEDATVGRGVPGLIVTEISGWGFGTTGIHYRFTALTNRGKKVWSRSYDSTIAGDWPITFAATDYVLTAAPFDALPGRATDVLIASGIVVVPPQWNLASGAITAHVIDGRDGSIVRHPVPEIGAGFVPFAGAMDDFDRDGLDDYVFVNQRPNASPGDDGGTTPVTVGTGLVAARRGTDGFPLWAGGGLDLFEHNVQLTNLGDIVGTKEGDVFVETQEQLLGENMEAFTYLIEGEGGRLLWKRRGLWPYSPGDVDRDGGRDVLTQHYYSSDGFVATNVRAYSGKGRPLWRKEYRLENPLTTCCSWLLHWGGGWGVGDYDGDAASDGHVWLHAHGEPLTQLDDEEANLVIDAASGRVLAEGGEELQPLGPPAVDGGRSDYARVYWDAGGTRITVHDGTTSALLTSSDVAFDVPLPPKETYVYVESGRLNPDRCADVAVSVYSPAGHFELMLDGADGSILWWRSIGLRDGAVRLAGSTDANDAC